MSERGFSLVELLAVIVILAITSTIAYPLFSESRSQQQVFAAGLELSNAIQFAQSDALRSGEHRVVQVRTDTTVAVRSVNQSTNPPTADSLLVHPLTHQDYSIKLSDFGHTRGVQFTGASNAFQRGTTQFTDELFFNQHGRPYVISAASNIVALQGVDLTVEKGAFALALSVDPISGRVQTIETAASP